MRILDIVWPGHYKTITLNDSGDQTRERRSVMQQLTTRDTQVSRHRERKAFNHTYIKEKIMTKSEESTSVTTVAQTKTSTGSDKGQTRTLSVRGGRGDKRIMSGITPDNLRKALTNITRVKLRHL